MRSDPALAALRDIAHHIELATRFAAGFTFEAFRDDLRTLYAVTRCLEIVSEASRRLPAELNLPPLRVVIEAELQRREQG
jgi:uncharacterized protein with HEPN domain